MLWKLIPDESIAPVVVRVFGLQTDKLIDRSREQDILLQLNKAGFGAQVSHLCPQTCDGFPCRALRACVQGLAEHQLPRQHYMACSKLCACM